MRPGLSARRATPSGGGAISRGSSGLPMASSDGRSTTERLAAVLVEAARSAGARIEHARLAAEDLAAIEAPIVLDCSGRTGLVARARGWRVYEPALRTVALVAAWRRPDGWPVPDQTHTLIESYADGWVWSVPSLMEPRHVAVMVDPRTTDLAKAQPARDIYLAEIAKTRQFASLLARCDARGRACRVGRVDVLVDVIRRRRGPCSWGMPGRSSIRCHPPE